MRGALKLLFPALCLLTSLAPAQSPSFDCHNATTPREHAICTTPDLAALDVKVATAYKSTLASLSLNAAQQVRSDQREWLHWLDCVCPRSTLPTGTIHWHEVYHLIATLPPETPGILEVADNQADSPATATRIAREVFSHAAHLVEQD